MPHKQTEQASTQDPPTVMTQRMLPRPPMGPIKLHVRAVPDGEPLPQWIHQELARREARGLSAPTPARLAEWIKVDHVRLDADVRERLRVIMQFQSDISALPEWTPEELEEIARLRALGWRWKEGDPPATPAQSEAMVRPEVSAEMRRQSAEYPPITARDQALVMRASADGIEGIFWRRLQIELEAQEETEAGSVANL